MWISYRRAQFDHYRDHDSDHDSDHDHDRDRSPAGDVGGGRVDRPPVHRREARTTSEGSPVSVTHRPAPAR